MNARLVQCLLLALAWQSAPAEPLAPGATYQIDLTDIDQRRLSTADGHVTLVCIVTRANQHDARVVADRVPRVCYGDPKFRMITIANLSSSFAALRPLLVRWIRHRVDLEADRLQAIYRARHLERNARQDVHVVADFTGEVAARFGAAMNAQKSSVFVFAPDGRLVAKWDRPPPPDDLASVLERAATAM